MQVVILVGALLAAAFNVYLAVRFLAFMAEVERGLGQIQGQVEYLAKRLDSAAAGTDVRLEALINK